MISETYKQRPNEFGKFDKYDALRLRKRKHLSIGWFV